MSEQAEMIKIAWSDVRAGDVLFHENGDRLTVERGGEVIIEAVGHELATDAWAHMGFTPYRKVEPLPTEPGAYLDKDGDYWLRDRDGNWYDWSSLRKPTPDGGDPEIFAPLTRLVPMPTREQVHATVYNALRGSAVEGMYPLRTINAVIALFEQEADSE